MTEIMARIYRNLILAGRRTIDDVPEALRDAVQKLLDSCESDGK